MKIKSMKRQAFIAKILRAGHEFADGVVAQDACHLPSSRGEKRRPSQLPHRAAVLIITFAHPATHAITDADDAGRGCTCLWPLAKAGKESCLFALPHLL